MDPKIFVSIFLPLGLALMNFGIGLGLKFEDFLKVKNRGKPIFVGLVMQILLVPLIAYFLSVVFELEAGLAMGVVLLASAPSGVVANFYSHLAKGEVALNVTLSALSSVWGVFYIPLMVTVSYALFDQSGGQVPFEWGKIVQLIVLLMIPLVVGMYVAKSFVDWTLKYRKLINRLALGYLVILVISAFFNYHKDIGLALKAVGLVVILFNIITMAMGYYGSRLVRLNRRESIAITFELCIHHCSLIIAIALNPQLLNNINVAMPSVVYILWMHVAAASLVLFTKKTKFLESEG